MISFQEYIYSNYIVSIEEAKIIGEHFEYAFSTMEKYTKKFLTNLNEDKRAAGYFVNTKTDSVIGITKDYLKKTLKRLTFLYNIWFPEYSIVDFINTDSNYKDNMGKDCINFQLESMHQSFVSFNISIKSENFPFSIFASIPINTKGSDQFFKFVLPAYDKFKTFFTVRRKPNVIKFASEEDVRLYLEMNK